MSRPTIKLFEVKWRPLRWALAVDAISSAHEIVVIGYSLPASDISSRELLAYGLRRNKICPRLQVVTRSLHDSAWASFAHTSGKESVRIAGSLEEWALNK